MVSKGCLHYMCEDQYMGPERLCEGEVLDTRLGCDQRYTSYLREVEVDVSHRCTNFLCEAEAAVVSDSCTKYLQEGETDRLSNRCTNYLRQGEADRVSEECTS